MSFKKSEKIKSVLKQLFTKQRSIIIVDKLLSRLNYFFRKKINIVDFEEYLIEISEFCSSKDEKLWAESKEFGRQLTKDSSEKLRGIEFPLGGGGAYELLYFITRYIKPNIIIETGVAAGFSSKAFLVAIDINKKGKLYSSDFPYFKEKNPEKYIGILVDEKYKKNWDLCIEGDINFIKKINGLISEESVDFLHYDSDKSYRSRKKTFNSIKKYLKKNCVIIFDDIQDNLHFSHLLAEYKKDRIKIFKFSGKYIGMIWNI